MSPIPKYTIKLMLTLPSSVYAISNDNMYNQTTLRIIYKLVMYFSYPPKLFFNSTIHRNQMRTTEQPLFRIP